MNPNSQLSFEENPSTSPVLRGTERRDDAARLPHVEVQAASELPTRFGAFRIYVFSNDRDSAEHVAMVRGDVWGAQDVPARLHSECLTGDIMASLRCDCREQLAQCGVPVTQRLPHAVEPGEHNRAYLETKARRSGHLLDVVSPEQPEAG